MSKVLTFLLLAAVLMSTAGADEFDLGIETTLGNLEIACHKALISGVSSLSKARLERELEVDIISKFQRLKSETPAESNNLLSVHAIESEVTSTVGGYVKLDVHRTVLVQTSDKWSYGIMWSHTNAYIGPPDSVKRGVLDLVNELVTQFAADYYKAGNE